MKNSKTNTSKSKLIVRIVCIALALLMISGMAALAIQMIGEILREKEEHEHDHDHFYISGNAQPQDITSTYII